MLVRGYIGPGLIRANKKCDEAQTPYQRVLAASGLQEDLRKDYEELYQRLNPVDLMRQIEAAQERLLKLPRSDS